MATLRSSSAVLAASAIARSSLPHRLGYPSLRSSQRADRTFCNGLARHAVCSLYHELTLYPKPGLVSLVDNGSHTDMDASTFMRSLFALRHYFRAIAWAGMRRSSFAELKALAIAAETRMLKATAGINTHRGAIFCMGMLCAAMAACRAQQIALSIPAVRAVLLILWGEALTAHAAIKLTDVARTDVSHGLQVAADHAVGGAREEGALGFPAVFKIALPQLQASLAAGRDVQSARVDTLFALMARISDTNIYHRGGAGGAALVRQTSLAFLQAGGTGAADWQARAEHIHHQFVQERLSPGGAADLLAAACLVQAICAAHAQ